jgi:glycosyltransferase 2 family protein
VTGQPDTNSSRRSWLRTALRTTLQYGGSALILYLLFRLLPRKQVWKALGLLPARLWVLVLVGYLAAHVVGAMKYELVLNLGGAGIPGRQAARCYFAGLFGSLFLPSLIGGDILRMAMALRMSRSKAGVVLGSLVDRITDFSSLALLAAFGSLLVPGALNEANRKIFFAVAVAGTVGALIVAIVVTMFPARRFSIRVRRKLVRLRRAWRSILRQPSAMARALGMSLVVQITFIFLNVLLADACGLHLPYRVWIFAWPLAKLSAVVPVTQAGIGVREAALAALLLPFGAPAVLAVAAGIAWDAVVVGGAIAGGIFALVTGRLWRQSAL